MAKHFDLVNPWQRDQAAGLIRCCRLGTATSPVKMAAQHARKLALRASDRHTALAYNFIADRLLEGRIK